MSSHSIYETVSEGKGIQSLQAKQMPASSVRRNYVPHRPGKAIPCRRHAGNGRKHHSATRKCFSSKCFSTCNSIIRSIKVVL